MTFRDFLTGCWLASVVIVLVGISYLHAAGKLQWMPVAEMIGLAVCVPLVGFIIGVIVYRGFRNDGNQ